MGTDMRCCSTMLSPKIAGIFNSARRDSGIDNATPIRAIVTHLERMAVFCEFASAWQSKSITCAALI